MAGVFRRRVASLVRSAGASVLRRAILRRAALRAAAVAGRGLTLVYHRVRPEGQEPNDIVPTLPTDVLRQQLVSLAELGDIVPLPELCEPPVSRRRVRFALSFDDDESTHVEHALPLLRSLGLPATFFLSGRSLHGIGPYWWQCLEQLIGQRGLQATCHVLGVRASSPRELAARCEGTPACDRICAITRCDGIPALNAPGIRALSAAGMEIGFHTIHHPVLTALRHDELNAALQHGRVELSDAVGAPLRLLAYPHGRANATVAKAAAAAGYAAAFASGGRPIGSRSDRFFLGRWDPGAVGGDRFLAAVALRLIRPDDAPRE